MPLDIEYNASSTYGEPDNVLGDDGNYSTISGARAKAGRLIAAWYKSIDGVGMGNRAWAELERASDTPTNRALLARYCEDALKPLVKSGEIADVEVTVDDPTATRGVAALVRFTDVRDGDTATLGVIAPWGID